MHCAAHHNNPADETRNRTFTGENRRTVLQSDAHLGTSSGAFCFFSTTVLAGEATASTEGCPFKAVGCCLSTVLHWEEGQVKVPKRVRKLEICMH